MTADEPFLRAIWAAPDDRGRESVYADWLEERGDPRGEYLRARLALGDANLARRVEFAQRAQQACSWLTHSWLVLLEAARLPVHVESWLSDPAREDAPAQEITAESQAWQVFTFEQ